MKTIHQMHWAPQSGVPAKAVRFLDNGDGLLSLECERSGLGAFIASLRRDDLQDLRVAIDNYLSGGLPPVPPPVAPAAQPFHRVQFANDLVDYFEQWEVNARLGKCISREEHVAKAARTVAVENADALIAFLTIRNTLP